MFKLILYLIILVTAADCWFCWFLNFVSVFLLLWVKVQTSACRSSADEHSEAAATCWMTDSTDWLSAWEQTGSDCSLSLLKIRMCIMSVWTSPAGDGCWAGEWFLLIIILWRCWSCLSVAGFNNKLYLLFDSLFRCEFDSVFFCLSRGSWISVACLLQIRVGQVRHNIDFLEVISLL